MSASVLIKAVEVEGFGGGGGGAAAFRGVQVARAFSGRHCGGAARGGAWRRASGGGWAFFAEGLGLALWGAAGWAGLGGTVGGGSRVPRAPSGSGGSGWAGRWAVSLGLTSPGGGSGGRPPCSATP